MPLFGESYLDPTYGYDVENIYIKQISQSVVFSRVK